MKVPPIRNHQSRYFISFSSFYLLIEVPLDSISINYII
jgi:hypothetical protein